LDLNRVLKEHPEFYLEFFSQIMAAVMDHQNNSQLKEDCRSSAKSGYFLEKSSLSTPDFVPPLFEIGIFEGVSGGCSIPFASTFAFRSLWEG